MTGRRRPWGVGEQPARRPDEIMTATSIEDLMPDPDRRDAALDNVLAAIKIRHLADQAHAAGLKELSIKLHDLARAHEAKEQDQ